MQKDEIIKTLIDFGLDNSEAAVYLAALNLGPSSVQEIAKAAEIKRTTAYPIIDNLKSKGLITTEIHGLKKLFAAESPERLEGIIEFNKLRLKKILPELNAIHNFKAGQSFIKYYQGANGFRAAYDSILEDLKPGDEYLIMSDVKKVMGVDEAYLSEFIKKRSEMDLKIRTILQDSDYAREYARTRNGGNQQIKFFPKSTDITANLIILPTKVIITQTVSPIMTTVIENKSIVSMHHEQFNIIWETLS